MPRLGCIRRDARFGALPFPARNQWSARFHQWDLELVGHAIAFSVGDKSLSLTMSAVSSTFLSAHTPCRTGSGIPNHYVGDLLSAIEISGLSRVRTETFETGCNPPLAPHPVQMHRQLTRHGHLRNLPPTSQGEVEELTAPLCLTPYCHLRRFH